MAGVTWLSGWHLHALLPLPLWGRDVTSVLLEQLMGKTPPILCVPGMVERLEEFLAQMKNLKS